MKEILEQYGSSLLAAIVAFAVFALFTGLPFYGYGKSGVAAAAGMLYCAGGTEQLSEHVNAAYSDYKTERKPEIFFYEWNLPVAERSIRIDAFCEAMDGAGNVLPVQIVSVKNAVGTECTEEVIKDAGESLCFLRSGIYELYVRACDSAGRYSTGIISIPVQPSGGTI